MRNFIRSGKQGSTAIALSVGLLLAGVAVPANAAVPTPAPDQPGAATAIGVRTSPTTGTGLGDSDAAAIARLNALRGHQSVAEIAAITESTEPSVSLVDTTTNTIVAAYTAGTSIIQPLTISRR